MIAEVQQAFSCEVTAFPCKYLGIPLSPKRLRHADEQPLIDSVAARIPSWKSGLLTNAGRLLLIKVVLAVYRSGQLSRSIRGEELLSRQGQSFALEVNAKSHGQWYAGHSS